MFVSLTDWKQFTKLTKSKVKIEDDGSFVMHNKTVEGRNKELVEDRLIVQDWRCTDWAEEHWAECKIELGTSDQYGTRVTLLLTGVPYDKAKAVENVWKQNVWKKLGGVLCADVEQQVLLRGSPESVYSLWLDADKMSAALKTKYQAPSEPNGTFSAYNAALKGTCLSLEPTRRIRLLVSHRDWTGMHPSIVSLGFSLNRLGTVIEFSHQNVPLRSLKAIKDMWTQDYWDKLEAVTCDEIHASLMLATPPSYVYKVLLSDAELSLITGTECIISPELGAEVSLYGKMIKGKVVELLDNKRIVLVCRAFDWPCGHKSICTYEVAEHNGGAGTLLTFSQTFVPTQKLADAQDRWERFANLLKDYCAAKAPAFTAAAAAAANAAAAPSSTF